MWPPAPHALFGQASITCCGGPGPLYNLCKLFVPYLAQSRDAVGLIWCGLLPRAPPGVSLLYHKATRPASRSRPRSPFCVHVCVCQACQLSRIRLDNPGFLTLKVPKIDVSKVRFSKFLGVYTPKPPSITASGNNFHIWITRFRTISWESNNGSGPLKSTRRHRHFLNSTCDMGP